MERQFSRIYDISRELWAAQGIPDSYRVALEQRLPIAFRSFDRRPRLMKQRTPRSKKEYSRQKKANKVYQVVFEMDPSIFLPFILAISPRACEAFNLIKFCQQHQKQDGIRLVNREFLDGIAYTQGIRDTAGYKRLTERLFPTPAPVLPPATAYQIPPLPATATDPTLPPVTMAESDGHWAACASTLQKIRDSFGDQICDAVKMSQRQAQQEDQGLSECVAGRFPRLDFQDMIFSIEIGCARQFKDILFHSARQRSLGSEEQDGK